MSAIDEAYKRVVNEVRTFGKQRSNRTGVDTIAVPSAMFQYDMIDGFPILHNKKISFQTSKVELAGFLQGITSKEWYRENGCSLWQEWANPTKIDPSLTGQARLDAMRYEDDLGPVYGAVWNRFNEARGPKSGRVGDMLSESDQIQTLLNTLKNNPDSRRMIVSAWNPLQLKEQALPPCHFAWQVLVMGDELHLNWNQRSVDVFLGLPYNITFYGTLLTLLAHQFGYKPGMLTGFLGDTHIYENHFDAMEIYLSRPDAECNPELEIKKTFTCVSQLMPDDIKLKNYQPHSQIKAPVAI